MRILSGVQPTGSLHLGNYLGAIRQFVSLQNTRDTECLYCVVDLHAITQKQDPKSLAENTRKIAAAYLAAGVDPKKAHIFVQSSVPHHTELNWYLQCVSRVGWLDRMTQFREKAGGSTNDLQADLLELSRLVGVESVAHTRERIAALMEKRTHREKASVGLYTYPVLQAADILLYKATHVPVGEDQLQHINLAADVAGKFNHDFADVFPKPQPIVSKDSARIMSLRDGTKKMSKSDPDDNSRINLDDSNDMIARKIKKATAQTEPLPATIEELTSPHARNLVSLFATMQGVSLQDGLTLVAGQGCGYLKNRLTEALCEHIGPIRDEMSKLLDDPLELDSILCGGGQRVEVMADKTLKEVRTAFGFWNPLDCGGMPYV